MGPQKRRTAVAALEYGPEFIGPAALLFPINWPEPFGLVMIEAMACGTPVIAWPRGSVPEIVEDGITGFLVESEAEAVAAIGRIRDLDRRHIRERFDERFTARRMAEEYINSYRMLMFQSQMHVETRQIKRTETPLNSSSTLSMRYLRPSWVRSSTKS
jgi:hypothetical protein